MKPQLLFVSHRMPWPPDKGEKIRAWHLIGHLARDFDVHLGCVVGDPADLAHIGRMQGVCASVGAFPIGRRRQLARTLLHLRPGRPLMPDFYYSPGLRAWVDALAARVALDVVYIFSVAMAPHALHLAAGRTILDAQDIDSEKWLRYAADRSFPARQFWAREGRTLLAYERAAAARAEVTFFVSEPEARRFRELAPEIGERATYVENGVDLTRFAPGLTFARPYPEARRALVFTGNMDYWPNADAVTWFAQAVMPRLRAAHGDLEFWIVGANPASAVKALAALPGVHVTGRVADTRPYVAHAAACVCPLRIARGIQNKVLEGMAMGRPVIASPPAFEGVRAEAGRDLLVADGAAAFAAAVEAVLGGAHEGMGRAARAAMERGYAWAAVLGRLDRWLGLPARS